MMEEILTFGFQDLGQVVGSGCFKIYLRYLAADAGQFGSEKP
jgi:hypothetical protein